MSAHQHVIEEPAANGCSYCAVIDQAIAEAVATDNVWGDIETALRGRGSDWTVTIENYEEGDGYFEPHVRGLRAKVVLGTAFPQWSQTVSGSIEPDLAGALRSLHAAIDSLRAKP